MGPVIAAVRAIAFSILRAGCVSAFVATVSCRPSYSVTNVTATAAAAWYSWP